MKALILAAGVGRRLEHQTEDLPKALVPVLGKPILEYQLEALLENGIDEVVIVTGHHGQKIIDFMSKQFPKISVQFVENSDFSETNSAYSFWLAKGFVEGEAYVHMNCDIIFSPSLLSEILRSEENNILAIDRGVSLEDNMEQVMLQGKKITFMDNIHYPEAVAKVFGLAKLSSETTKWMSGRIQEYLDSGDRNQNFFGMIRQAVQVFSYFGCEALGETLLEVNTLDDLKKAEKKLKNKNSLEEIS